MQQALLTAVMTALILICVETLTGGTYQSVYRADNGIEFVTDHNMSYMDCLPKSITPSIRCVRED